MKTKKRFHKLTAWVLTLAMLMAFMPNFTFTVLAADGDIASVTTADGLTSYHTDITSAVNAAMQNSGSTLKLLDYIFTNTCIKVEGGTFTIDLNGQTWESASEMLRFRQNADVTITDSSVGGAGKMVAIADGSGLGYPTIYFAGDAKLEIAGGTVENAVDTQALDLSWNGSEVPAELTVSGGHVNTNGPVAINANGDLVKITGGTIWCKTVSIWYRRGEIDLSRHSDPTGLTIRNASGADLSVSGTVHLPKGYTLLDSAGNAANTFVNGQAYTVGVTPVVTTYAITVSVPENGAIEPDKTIATAGAIVILTVTPDDGMAVKQVIVTDGNQNEIKVTNTTENTYSFIMPAGNVTVSAVFEETAETYDLWVGGEQFTSEKSTITDGSGGTAKYDPESNTLTLTNYNFTGDGYDRYNGEQYAAIYYGGTKMLNLVLEGDSTVTQQSAAELDDSYGIFSQGSITVSGNGSLTVNSGSADYESIGVYINGDAVIVSDGKLTANGGTANDYSEGLSLYGSFSISRGTVEAHGGTADISYGIDVYVDVNVSGGSITATGGTANEQSYGVEVTGNINVTGGSLTAKGGEATAESGLSYGICSSEHISVSGGDLKGIGSKGNSSYGVHGSSIAVSGTGDLSGMGGEVTGAFRFSVGVNVGNSITVADNGRLTGIGDTSGVYSYGVVSFDTTINGGETIAQGETSAFYSAPTITDTFANAAVWSGTDETEANIEGEQPINKLMFLYIKKYVKIAEGTPAPTYNIIVNTSENGTVVADKTTAKEGDTVTLTVTPADGYELDVLIVKDADNNDVTVTDNKFTMPAKAVTVTATFKPSFSVSVSIGTAYTNTTTDFYRGDNGTMYCTFTFPDGVPAGQMHLYVNGEKKNASWNVSASDSTTHKKTRSTGTNLTNGENVVKFEFVPTGSTESYFTNEITITFHKIDATRVAKHLSGDVDTTVDYDGNVKTVGITSLYEEGANTLYLAPEQYTVTYWQGEQQVAEPTEPGVYDVKISVPENDYYAQITNHKLCTLTINAPTTYTVTFNANGGTAVDEQTVENGSTITQPTAPTKTGYTFGGWYRDSDLQNEWNFASDTVTAPTILYAKWTANTNTPYTVKHWIQNLGAGTDHNETNFTLYDTEELTGTTDTSVNKTIEIEGFGFDGVDAEKKFTIAADGSTVHNYYYTRKNYRVSINTYDAVESVSGNGTYQYGATVNINITLKPGYKWIKWEAGSGGIASTEQSYSFTMPAKTFNLDPKFEEKATVIIDETNQFADYDETVKAFRIISDDALEGFTISYKQNGQDVTPVNAGFYDVILSRAEDENYKAYSKTLVNGLIINKVVVDEPEVETKLYSGSLQTADITNTDIYEVTKNEGGIDVGEYDVILTLKDTVNYKWRMEENSGATVTRKFFITFTENTWDVEPQITGWTFGQEPSEPTFDAKFGEVVVEYKKDSEDELAYTTNVPADAGNYNVRFTVTGGTNFSGLSKVIDLNIAKATPSLEAPTAQNGITYGAKLNTVELPDGWTWFDGTTIPTVQNSGFAAYFIPDDTENYDWTVINGWDATESRVERTVAVTVTKNNPSYTAPTGLTATYGQTLADVQLTEGWNWKAPTTSVGNAGTNTFAAVFTPVDTDNYNTVEVDLTITVARQKVAKPAENVTVFTYNSNEQIYTLTEDARYEITNNKRKDAGNQTVTIALKDSANYEWADGSVDDVEYTFTIAKATADIAVDTAPIVKTYGEALTLPTATSTFGIPVCDKTVAQLSDVGSYEVTYSVAETPNYYGDTETLSVTINPAIISKPTADNTEFVYNGLMQTYSVSSNSNYTVSGNTRTDAGEQTVTVTLTDKHNYRWDDNSTDDVTFTFTIAQKEIGIEWGTTQFTYNKTEQKPNATATGLAAGDSCTITVTGGQTNTGNGYVATAQSLSNVNYKLPAIKTTTFSIAQKSVTVTGVTIEATKVYDGETNAAITNYGTVSNVIDGDNVTVNNAGASATYNDKNVGNGKSVTFTGFAITGTDAANYVLTGQPESQSANITPKPVTITGVTVAATKIYDDNVTASIENNGSVDGVISGDAVGVNSSGATAVYDDANVGTDKAVTFAGFAISGADASNYELSTQPASATANITAKDITGAEITLGEALSYNGNAQSQTIASAIVDGLTITYDVSGNVNTDAGNYTLTITGNGNFEGTAQKVYTIARADATLGTAPSAIAPLTYNATEQILVNAGENVVDGTLMYKLGEGEYSAELPKAIEAGTYTVYYKVFGDNNHNDTAEQQFTVTIAEKTISPAIVLTAPVANAAPQTTIETDEYTASVVWSPEVTDKFAYSTAYTATITLTPKTNYTVTGITENGYTVSGAESVTNIADSGNITIVYAETGRRPSSGGGGTTRYTVKFDTDGGSSVANKTVTRNSMVAEPTVPEKEGYTFMGWFTDKALTEAYDFDTKVTKNITLYAKWEKVDDDKPEDPDNTGSHNCPSKEFDDIDVNAWYHLDTDYVIKNGIFRGVTENEFAPNDKLTRAMLVTVLYRVEGEPATNRSIPFADVDMGAYYANAVVWAQQNGIVKGVSETEFAPDDNITREQIAAIMHRYAQYKGYDVSVGENTNILSYDDFDSISEYAIAAMQYACGSGLMKGKTASTLNPLDNATRAEIAAILHRFIEANK